MIINRNELNPDPWIPSLVGVTPVSSVSEGEPESPFRLIFKGNSAATASPLYKLRHLLLQTGELLDDGSVKSHGPLSLLPLASISKLKMEQMLSYTITINDACRFTVKELVTFYMKLYPNHEIHWIGSSLPLDSHWIAQCLKDFSCDPKIMASLTKCLPLVNESFADIDIRFMTPPGSPHDNYLKTAIEKLCQMKTEDPTFLPDTPSYFCPNEGTKVLSIKKGILDPYDIDLIQCSRSTPPHLTTLDTAYIPLGPYLKYGVSTPRFLIDTTPGCYIVHKLAKIYYIPDRSRINPGSFKRYIQFATRHFLTPQSGLIKEIITTFLSEKGGKKQFLAVFKGRKEHLSASPKTVLAYALNLISCIDEFYDEKYKIDYWKQCAHLIEIPEEGLSKEIAHFIQENYHACGFLMTILKSCGLMTYAARQLSLEHSAALLNVSVGVQNGESYLSLPIADSSIHMKLNVDQTHVDLIDILESTSTSTRKGLVHILIEFLQRLFQVRFAGERDTTLLKLENLGLDPAMIQERFSYISLTEEPVIHALNIFWKAIFHISHPLDAEDVTDILRSLAPALSLFPKNKHKLQLLHFIASHFRSDIIHKVLETLKKSPRFDFSTTLSTIFKVMGDDGVALTESGFQIWMDTLSHPNYVMGAKCESLVNLIRPSYHERVDIWNHRIASLIDERKVNPLIMARFFLEQELYDLAMISFDGVTKDDISSFPSSLVVISRYQEFTVPRRQKLVLYLVQPKFMELAFKHLKKIPPHLLSSSEKAEMGKAATQIVNDLIAKKQPNQALSTYNQFVKKGLLRKNSDCQWNFLAKALAKFPLETQLKEEWVENLTQLLHTSTVLGAKKGKQVIWILSRILTKLSFNQKSVILCKFYLFALNGKSDLLLTFHQRQFTELIKSSNENQKLTLARLYAQHDAWTFSAKALLKIPEKVRPSATSLVCTTLSHFSEANAMWMWRLLLSYYKSIDAGQLGCLSEKSFPYFPHVHKSEKLKGRLSSLITKIATNNPNLALQLLDKCLHDKIKMRQLPSLFKLVGSHIPNHRCAWRRYLAICQTQNTRECSHERLKCLKAIKDQCVTKEDHEMTPDIVDHWSEWGIHENDLPEWIYLAELELFSYHQSSNDKAIISRLQSLERSCRPYSFFSQFVAKYFADLHQVFQRRQDISPESLYLLWDKYQAILRDQNDSREKMKAIAWDEKNIGRVWGLAGGHDDPLPFFHSPCHTPKEYQTEHLWTRKWIERFDLAASEETSTFYRESLPGFLQVVNQNILNTQSSWDDRKVIKKVVNWAKYPEDFFHPTGKVSKKQLEDLTSWKFDLLSRIVMGLWTLTHNNPLKLKKSVIHRLRITGAVLWILSQRLGETNPHYRELKLDFDQIAVKYRRMIEEALQDHPKSSQHCKILNEAETHTFLWKLFAKFIRFLLNDYVLIQGSIILQSLIFYFLFLAGRKPADD